MEQKILDIIAICSAIGSCGFWLASREIEIRLEGKIDNAIAALTSKIDNSMITVTSRMQRQQDRNKSQIGILNAEVQQIKSVLSGNPASIDLSAVKESLPDEYTDFN
jgi:hypothetical protein